MPFEVPAGASVDLECMLEVPQPGAFASDIHLYFDDLGLREIIFTVHGNATP